MKAPSLPDAENLLIPESLMAPSEPRMVGRKMEKLNPKKKKSDMCLLDQRIVHKKIGG
jgi:hypothetical protein